MSLLSDSELAAIQGVALSGMTTSVGIYHGATVKNDTGQKWAYPTTPDLTVLGWLTELTGQSPRLDVIDGQTAVSETHRLFLPVGTDCRVGDKVVINSGNFIVQSVNQDDTYPAALRCYLRIQR